MPSNEYYDSTGAPTTGSAGNSATVRAEFDAIEEGFKKLPVLTGNNSLPVFVDSGGSALEAKSLSAALTALGAENLTHKDASGGYAGLTLFKINFKNALNTFTSFFTNANAAARTYTFPDKDGTVAMTSDITGTNTGNNTGDQDLTVLVPKTTTVNGHALTTDVTVSKSDVGLGSCDNTSDANKPVSTAAQTALNLKSNLADPTFTGVPAAPTAVAGTNTTQLATTAFVAAAVGTSGGTGILCVQDEKTSGTSGGASSGTTTHTRTLNQTKINTITGASLASSQVTLPAGTYEFEGLCPAGGGIGFNKARLYNVTDVAYAVEGNTEYNSSGSPKLHGFVVIVSQKVFELRHYITGADASGLGSPMSQGTEVYAQLIVRKLA